MVACSRNPPPIPTSPFTIGTSDVTTVTVTAIKGKTSCIWTNATDISYMDTYPVCQIIIMVLVFVWCVFFWQKHRTVCCVISELGPDVNPSGMVDYPPLCERLSFWGVSWGNVFDRQVIIIRFLISSLHFSEKIKSRTYGDCYTKTFLFRSVL